MAFTAVIDEAMAVCSYPTNPRRCVPGSAGAMFHVKRRARCTTREVAGTDGSGAFSADPEEISAANRVAVNRVRGARPVHPGIARGRSLWRPPQQLRAELPVARWARCCDGAREGGNVAIGMKPRTMSTRMWRENVDRRDGGGCRPRRSELDRVWRGAELRNLLRCFT